MGKIVGLVIVGVLVVGIVAYFVSDPFQTKVDTEYERLTDWPPERIAEDPEGFLRSCERKTIRAMEGMKASEIGITQNRHEIERMAEGAKKKVQVGTKALGELKGLYRGAEKEKGWPVQWRGQAREQEWTKRQIVALHAQVQSQNAIVSKCDLGRKKLDAQMSRVQALRAKAEQQLAELKANLQIVKINKLSKEIQDRMVAMGAAIEVTVTDATEVEGVISLDDLTRDEEAKIDEAAFDAIMGGK